VGHARLALPMPVWTVVNGAEGLTGSCKACGTTLDRALVREVRHYEQTRLLDVICGGCERHFLAIQVEAKIEALKAEDVTEAAALRSRGYGPLEGALEVDRLEPTRPIHERFAIRLSGLDGALANDSAAAPRGELEPALPNRRTFALAAHRACEVGVAVLVSN